MKKLKKAVISKAILKKEPRATMVIGASPEYERSSFFNKAYQKEKNILTWS